MKTRSRLLAALTVVPCGPNDGTSPTISVQDLKTAAGCTSPEIQRTEHELPQWSTLQTRKIQSYFSVRLMRSKPRSRR